jgi:NhaP-type Na+/H+ or K+/H+ antiporter
MPNRIGGILALIAFALCLTVGAFEADNPFGTVVIRALGAMVGTFVVGYVLGLMAERMLRDPAGRSEIPEKNVQESAADGR